MIELIGAKHQIVKMKSLVPLSIRGFPSKLPKIPNGHDIVCELDHGDGERIFTCKSLKDMQELYREYALGHAVSISWYHTDAFKDASTS
jgi:hypothetical protein